MEACSNNKDSFTKPLKNENHVRIFCTCFWIVSKRKQIIIFLGVNHNLINSWIEKKQESSPINHWPEQIIAIIMEFTGSKRELNRLLAKKARLPPTPTPPPLKRLKKS